MEKEKVILRRWGYIDVAAERIRTAVAIRFEFAGESFCWIEIDARTAANGDPIEYFVATLFRLRSTSNADACDDVRLVVDTLDRRDGRMAKVKQIGHLVTGVSIWHWKHAFNAKTSQLDLITMIGRLKGGSTKPLATAST